jgi:hypothetical protein
MQDLITTGVLYLIAVGAYFIQEIIIKIIKKS